jgi:tetratricopeptide (TPR) repeat protein
MDVSEIADWLDEAARLRLSDQTAVRVLAQRAHAASQALDNKELQGRSLCYLAWCEATEGDINRSIQTALQALMLAREHGMPGVEMRAMSAIGLAFSLSGNNYDALQVFERQYALADKHNDGVQRAAALNDIAINYSRNGQAERSTETLKRVSGLFDALSDEEKQTPDGETLKLLTLLNLSGSVQNTDPAAARAGYEGLLEEIAGKDCHVIEALSYLGIGLASLTLGDSHRGAEAIERMQQVGSKTSHPSTRIQICAAMSVVEQVNGRQDTALEHLREGIELCRTHRQDEYMIHLLRAVRDIQMRSEDMEGALETYRLIDQFIDTTLLSQMETRLSIVRAVNEVDKAWAAASVERERAEQLQREIELQREGEASRILAERHHAAAEHQSQLNQRKEAIILRLSHEIRNPLAAILVSSEVIQRYHARLSSQEISRQTEEIAAQVNRMTALLSGVLDALNLDQPPEL